MFEQDVAGLIKALRANKNDELAVIQRALDETRKEIKSKDVDVKAAAVLKLIYLEMLGQSITFASFAIVECMTSTKFHIKSIGYLAASQCFDKETEVAVLVVNLVKKDLTQPPTPMFSSSPSSLTVAHLNSTLSAVSLLLTPTLARDIAPDLLSLLTHSRPAVRKQTVLVMWRVVRSWPDVRELGSGREERGDDPWIERLRERLGDDDIGVISATVNLICEMARKDPKRYLPLAPELFDLLTASTNNWMLIKIIKLFAVLTPEEPRLVRKLVPPLTELIETTPAMSLLYECIQTSIVGGMLNGRDGEALAQTCVEKLQCFLEDVDQNLRYIALLALVKILPTHPHLVAAHYDTILSCVDDPDMSIRMRALDLIEGMVERRSLQPIVQRLMSQLRPSSSSSKSATSAAAASLLQAQQNSNGAAVVVPSPALSPAYRTSLVALILRMCAQQTYANVSNFPWLIDNLVDLAYISLTIQQDSQAVDDSLGARLSDTLIDVAARVKAVRPYMVKKMAQLLGDEDFLENGEGARVSEVLGAAAWICGEYCQDLQDSRLVIASLFATTTSSTLSPRVLSLYLHNGVKIYSHWLESLADNWDEQSLEQIRSITSALEGQLVSCARSPDVELQQRAAELSVILAIVKKGLDAPRSTSVVVGRGFGDDSADDLDPISATDSPQPAPPTLRLLVPFFTAHELNPVNPKAQSMVAVPDGLDLDAEIVSRAAIPRVVELDLSVDDVELDGFGRPLDWETRAQVQLRGEDKRRKKGKASSGGGKKIKTGRRAAQAEDSEELERLRLERLERQREDPYYVGSTAPPMSPAHEIDSIPIVQLELDGLTDARARVGSPPIREPTPPPVHVEIDGEMPDGSDLATPSAQSELPAAGHAPNSKVEAAAEPTETRAEERSVKKVVSKKKKGTGTKKKVVKSSET